MRLREKLDSALAIIALSLLAAMLALPGGAFAQGGGKVVTANLDDILRNNPLAAGQGARAAAVTRVPGAELQVIQMNKIKLH